MKALCVLTVRNEAAFLLEWLAHHRAVGFTDFLVYSNDCTDGTDLLLDRLDTLGWLTHCTNPGPYDARGIQFTALNAASKHPDVTEADWILPLDVDEFVNIHTGTGQLSDLLTALQTATAIPLTWRLFGNGGVIHYNDTPVTDEFTRAAPHIMHWPWRSVMFKTLYRNDGTYKKLGVHRPRAPDPDRLAAQNWIDGSGKPLPEPFKTQRIFSDYGQNNCELVQLNHYPLGAMASYVLKSDRGRAVHADHMLGLDYWTERNWCDEEDTSISKYAPHRNKILQQLKSDAEILRLHTGAVTWRKKRFDTLMAQDAFRALFARLLMSRPARQIPPQAAQFLKSYALKEMAAKNSTPNS